MAVLRPLVLACLRYNINFPTQHIPGHLNTLTDKLYCSQMKSSGSWRLGHMAAGVPSQLRDSLNQLLYASIAPSSRAHYERAWHQFVLFTVCRFTCAGVCFSGFMLVAMRHRLLYRLYQLLLIFIRLTVLQTRRKASLWPKCWLVPVILVRYLMSACLSFYRSSLVWCLHCPLCLHLDINALCSML